MTTPGDNDCDSPGFLQSLLKGIGRLFGCCEKKDKVSDDEIRKSVGGLSATSSRPKPGKKDSES